MRIGDESYCARLRLFLSQQGPVTLAGLIASERYYYQKEQEFRAKLKRDGELEDLQTVAIREIRIRET